MKVVLVLVVVIVIVVVVVVQQAKASELGACKPVNTSSTKLPSSEDL